MIAPRPYALLAEITYRARCIVLTARTRRRRETMQELTTDEWRRVIREAAALGVLQIGFSGGEPLARRDLAELSPRCARGKPLHESHHQRHRPG